MNLKEAFRYQNNLQALMDEAQGQCRTGAGHEQHSKADRRAFWGVPGTARPLPYKILRRSFSFVSSNGA